jgi:hypothetical protein
MIALIIFALILVFGAISLAFGVDSRDGSSDPRRSDYPIGLE